MRLVDRNLAIILFAAFTARMLFVFVVQAPTDTVGMETYDAVAVGGVFPPSTPPLYPLFLRAIYLVFGMRRYAAVYAIQGLVSCLVVVALFHWTVRFFDRSVATVAAVISAGYPNFILYNAAVLPVSLSVTLIASLMAVSVSRRGPGVRSAAGAALAGGGFLMNPVYLFFIPGLVVTARRKLIFAAVLVVTLAPWIVRTAVMHDTLVPVYGPHSSGIRFDAYARVHDAWDIAGLYYYGASIFMGGGWHSYVMDGTYNTLSYASHVRTLSYAVLVLLGLTGLIRYYRREHRAFLLPFFGYVVLSCICVPFDGRQRAALEPLLILYAAVLLVNECRALRSPRREGCAESGTSGLVSQGREAMPE